MGEDSYTALAVESEYQREVRPALNFYQQNVSIHDGATCRFHPTCSEFFRQATDRYGILWATLMTLERLLYREHGWDLRFYSPTEDGTRYADPVTRNFILDAKEYYR
jgi:putative component of membrane protein insertase Oxa1/YidC/SpoIIIJ protein YidD